MKIKKFQSILASILLMYSMSVLALIKNSHNPIHIESTTQYLNLKKNIAIFTGGVILTRVGVTLTADKIVITYLKNNMKNIIIDAYGQPVKFHYIQDDGTIIQAYATKIHYELKKDFIELTGDACLQQTNNNIKSSHIIYLIKKKKIQAYSNKDQSQRVMTTLIPKNHRI